MTLLEIIQKYGYHKTDKHTGHAYIPHVYDQCACRSCDNRITGWSNHSLAIVRLYKQGLTQSEVQANYDAQKKRFGH